MEVERVIEKVSWKVAGSGDCIQQKSLPARRSFGRLLECRDDRDSTALRTSCVRFFTGTRVHEPPAFFRGFLHCYYENVYGTRPITRELQKPLVWVSCGFDQPPSRDTVDRFLTDLEHVIDEVFDQLVEQAATRGLLDSTYRIDSTHVEAIRWNDDASWNYDPTAEEYYYGFGCTIVSTGAKIPIAVEFTEAKQSSEETAMRITRDALAVEQPVWMVGDSAYDTLDWHDLLRSAGGRASRPVQSTKHRRPARYRI